MARIVALGDLGQQEGVDVSGLDREALTELHERFEVEWRLTGFGYLMICRREDGQAIGHVHLKSIPDASTGRMAELLYAVAAAYRNHGYATEAVDAVLRFAFEEAGLDYVIACVEPDNPASIRVAEKCGMAPVGEGRVRHRLVRRFVLPAAMWRFQRDLRRQPPPTTEPSAGA